MKFKYFYDQGIVDRLEEELNKIGDSKIYERLIDSYPQFKDNKSEFFKDLFMKTKSGGGLFTDTWLFLIIAREYGISLDKIVYGNVKEEALLQILQFHDDLKELKNAIQKPKRKPKKDNRLYIKQLKNKLLDLSKVINSQPKLDITEQLISSLIFTSYNVETVEFKKLNVNYEGSDEINSNITKNGFKGSSINIADDKFILSKINNVGFKYLGFDRLFNITQSDSNEISLPNSKFICVDPFSSKIVLMSSLNESLYSSLSFHKSLKLSMNQKEILEEHKLLKTPEINKVLSIIKLKCDNYHGTDNDIKFLNNLLAILAFYRVLSLIVENEEPSSQKDINEITSEYNKLVNFLFEKYESQLEQYESIFLCLNKNNEVVDTIDKLNGRLLEILNLSFKHFFNITKNNQVKLKDVYAQLISNSKAPVVELRLNKITEYVKNIKVHIMEAKKIFTDIMELIEVTDDINLYPKPGSKEPVTTEDLLEGQAELITRKEFEEDVRNSV